ncbi:hypothetical protein Gotur_017749 [Gossypium turneri]
MELVFISIFLSCKEARKLPSLQPLWEYGVKLTGIPLVFWEEYLISVLLRIVNDLFVDGCRVGMIKDVTIDQKVAIGRTKMKLKGSRGTQLKKQGEIQTILF